MIFKIGTQIFTEEHRWLTRKICENPSNLRTNLNGGLLLYPLRLINLRKAAAITGKDDQAVVR